MPRLELAWIALPLMMGCPVDLTPDDPVDTVPIDDGGPGPLDLPIDNPDLPDPPVVIDEQPQAQGGWLFYQHPCIGHRTDTAIQDDSGRWWVGCGSTAEGSGLYYSDNGGANWETLSTDPPTYFDFYRVNDLWIRGNRIYASGANTSTGSRSRDAVVSFELGTPTPTVDSIFQIGDLVWNSFIVGTYRRNGEGVEVAESLVGNDLMIREGNGTWENGNPWTLDGNSYQMLDMEEHDGQLYGCGSTIGEPPTVFLPIPDTRLPFALRALRLAAHVEGEMWDLHVDEDGVVVGGVDQTLDAGMISISGPDPYDPEQWLGFRLDSRISQPTWIQGVCRSGEEVVAVGRYSQSDNALVLRSTDGGTSWSNITPRDTPALYVCEILDDGRLMVTGAEGVFAFWTP